MVQPASPRLVADSYWGAKEYDRVKGLGQGLEETVELGWFRFLALPLLRALRWLHDNVVANYGWAIILLTIGIRIVLFPLMHKSTVSMQKMQELNPKIQAIRAKYRGKLKDKQGRPNSEAQRKMNEEVMGLYKSEGVNPAGGCLPLLLQMPVLFAFYRLLSAAIELRQAPWLGWIQDLSAPGPALHPADRHGRQPVPAAEADAERGGPDAAAHFRADADLLHHPVPGFSQRVGALLVDQQPAGNCPTGGL